MLSFREQIEDLKNTSYEKKSKRCVKAIANDILQRALKSLEERPYIVSYMQGIDVCIIDNTYICIKYISEKKYLTSSIVATHSYESDKYTKQVFEALKELLLDDGDLRFEDITSNSFKAYF